MPERIVSIGAPLIEQAALDGEIMRAMEEASPKRLFAAPPSEIFDGVPLGTYQAPVEPAAKADNVDLGMRHADKAFMATPVGEHGSYAIPADEIVRETILGAAKLLLGKKGAQKVLRAIHRAEEVKNG